MEPLEAVGSARAREEEGSTGLKTPWNPLSLQDPFKDKE